MSYIGRGLQSGAFRQLDDISSGFDGSDTTHTMQVNSTNVTVGDVNQILLSLGGVIQKPGTDFTVSSSTLTFTTAPAANTSFFAILLGSDNGGTTTPTDESVTTGKLANTISAINNTGGDILLDSSADIILDADGADIMLKDGGTHFGSIYTNATPNNLYVQSMISDGDVYLSGNDGGSFINALVLDMSDAGAATLNNGLTLTDGNLIVASGHGIDFSATSDGTTMSSELLDDYEEGDCTLGFTTSSGAMGMHSTYKYGKYTKVGNLVTVTGYVIGNGIGSATSSQGLTMTGLPFSIIGENGAYSSMNVSYGEGLNITAGQHIGGYARINYATVPLLLWDQTNGTSTLLQSELSNDGGFIFSIMYYVS
jgi:hypothetical protein